MTKNSQDELARAYAMLKSLRSNIDKMTEYSIPEKYVVEFHNALDKLERVGINVSEFRVPDSELKPRPGASMYVRGKEIFSSKGDICVKRSFILFKLDSINDLLKSKSEKPKIQKVPKQTSSNTVFVVHGRNSKLRESMFNFLRALGLNPVEWSQAIQATQKTSPYIGEILDTAFVQAQAIIVMFSGDDEARLIEEFLGQNEPSYEKELTPQPRPNVIFEAGMAMGRNEARTILVQVGEIRPISDIAGRHITRLDNSSLKRQELVTKLRGADCAVDTSGTDWLSVGDFQ